MAIEMNWQIVSNLEILTVYAGLYRSIILTMKSNAQNQKLQSTGIILSNGPENLLPRKYDDFRLDNIIAVSIL